MKSEAKITVQLEGADEAAKKAAHLVELLQEARTLAGELASDMNSLEISLR